MIDMILKPKKSELMKHWQLDEDVVFLNHGSFGACPKFIIEEQIDWIRKLEKEPVKFFERDFPELMKGVRETLASFLNCDSEDLALVTNATSGVNTVLRSLKFEKGDELLVPDHAYQACRNALDYVSEKWGASTTVCQLPFPVSNPDEIIDAVISAITPNTKSKNCRVSM